MTNFPRSAQGATVSLVSNDPSVTVPATVVVAQNAYSTSFTGTTSVVSAIRNVTITASYNGSTASGILVVNPVPTVTMIAAEYSTVTQIFKVQATTSYAASTLTFGTDPTLGPLGSMQVESPGVWGGATVMATAPKQATVWNSNGGQAS
ncbi:MAG TPA: hypothetical protein VNH18_05310, partial [Bryobacteraceae bacterium]|nr:hypothetical protein [Bryobacteraceae bacterium]